MRSCCRGPELQAEALRERCSVVRTRYQHGILRQLGLVGLGGVRLPCAPTGLRAPCELNIDQDRSPSYSRRVPDESTIFAVSGRSRLLSFSVGTGCTSSASRRARHRGVKSAVSTVSSTCPRQTPAARPASSPAGRWYGVGCTRHMKFRSSCVAGPVALKPCRRPSPGI